MVPLVDLLDPHRPDALSAYQSLVGRMRHPGHQLSKDQVAQELANFFGEVLLLGAYKDMPSIYAAWRLREIAGSAEFSPVPNETWQGALLRLIGARDSYALAW